MQKNSTVQNLVFVALFAALTFIGTTLKIPLPTGAFVHLGNAVLLLAVLLLGYVRGSLAGGVGFFLFDIFNGYATEAPIYLVESFIVGGAAWLTYRAFGKKMRTVGQVFIVACVTGVAKSAMSLLENVVGLLIVGASPDAALIGGLTKMPATIINVILTMIIVSLAYFPLKKGLAAIIARR
jgi:uncharacterized membrane protein